MERITKSTFVVAIALTVFGIMMVSGCRFNPMGVPIYHENNFCDDGIDNDGDGLTDCEDTDCSDDPVCSLCGNSTVDATNEECDSGPNCTDCKCDSGTIPDGYNGCLNPDLCGDGTTDPGEICDDGNNVSGDGCSADCLSDETCGNGYLDDGEVCDDGPDDTSECDAGDCSLPSCGDGYVNEALEECDDGVNNNSDIMPDACRTNCLLPTCGDGAIDSAEVCDDGNTVSGDGCNSDCTSNESCGNSTLDPGEECDDGQETATCNGDCTLQECGDGVLNQTAGEACDGGTDCVQGSCLCPEHLEPDGSGGCTASATACSDGVDGDNDGLYDCDDPDCWFAGTTCPEVCDDGVDNDGDGDTDCDDDQCGVIIVHVDDVSNGGSMYETNTAGQFLWSDTDNSTWDHTFRVDNATPIKRIWVYTGEVTTDSLDGWSFLSWNNNPGYPTPSPPSGVATTHHTKNSGSSTWTYYELYCPGMPLP